MSTCASSALSVYCLICLRNKHAAAILHILQSFCHCLHSHNRTSSAFYTTAAGMYKTMPTRWSQAIVGENAMYDKMDDEHLGCEFHSY